MIAQQKRILTQFTYAGIAMLPNTNDLSQQTI
jgi:hypothetical protein